MKNLAYHKKQIKQRQSHNRFQAWANNAVDTVCQPILASSQERMDRMQQELKLQRCKLKASIKAHPMYKPFEDFYGLLRIAEHFNREYFEPFI